MSELLFRKVYLSRLLCNLYSETNVSVITDLNSPCSNLSKVSFSHEFVNGLCVSGDACKGNLGRVRYFTCFAIPVDDKMAANVFFSQNKNSTSERDSLTPCNMHLTPCNMQKILHGYSSAK